MERPKITIADRLGKSTILSILSVISLIIGFVVFFTGRNLPDFWGMTNPADEYFNVRGNAYAYYFDPSEEPFFNEEGGYKITLSKAFQTWFRPSASLDSARIVGCDIDTNNIPAKHLQVRAIIDKEEHWDISATNRDSYIEYLKEHGSVDKRSGQEHVYTDIKIHKFERDSFLNSLSSDATLLIYFSANVGNQKVYTSVYYQSTKDAVYIIAVENYTDNNDYLVEFHKMINSFWVDYTFSNGG